MSKCTSEYLQLFNHVTDVIKILEQVTHQLKTAQMVAEELYVESNE